MAQDHRLTWGALTFAEPSPSPHADGWLIEAMADGWTFGNPGAIVEIVQSLLRDGSLAVIQGWDNREVVVRLRLSAPKATAGHALAKAEAALMAETTAVSPSSLVWTAPAEGAAATVFDVVTATLDRDYSEGWDLDEVQREERFYLLTLSCLPFARAQERDTLPALAPNPPAPTTSVIDDCSSSAAWSLESAGVGTVSRVNLMPNPSFGDGVDGWFAGNGNVTLQAASDAGDPCIRMYNNKIVLGSSSHIRVLSPAIPVTPGDDFAASIAVKDVLRDDSQPDVHNQSYLSLLWRNSSGDVIATADGGSVTATGSWQRISVTGTVPAGAVDVRVRVNVDDVDKSLRYWLYCDEVLLEQSASVGTYFDGDNPPSGGDRFMWAGDPDTSASIQYQAPPLEAGGGQVFSEADIITEQDSAYGTLSLVRDTPASMAGLPYLRVTYDVSTENVQYPNVKLSIDGQRAYPLASEPSATAGFRDYYYETGDFDRLELFAGGYWDGSGTPIVISRVAHVEATDTSPQLPKQRPRLATIGGSARTQAAIRLFDATPDALGEDVLVYTSQSDFAPNLRKDWLTSTAGFADPDAVSGAFNTLNSTSDPVVFRVPVASLASGQYALMCRLACVDGAQLDWEIKLTNDTGGDVVGSGVVTTDSMTLTSEDLTYGVRHLTQISLPPVEVDDDLLADPRFVQITLTNPTANDADIDEVWLFNLDDGALTWVNDPDEVLRWIEIRSPELDAPRQAIYGSVSVDGSNAADVSRQAESLGTHLFTPGETLIFTVTTNSTASQSEIEFYRRYLSQVVAE